MIHLYHYAALRRSISDTHFSIVKHSMGFQFLLVIHASIVPAISSGKMYYRLPS